MSRLVRARGTVRFFFLAFRRKNQSDQFLFRTYFFGYSLIEKYINKIKKIEKSINNDWLPSNESTRSCQQYRQLHPRRLPAKEPKWPILFPEIFLLVFPNLKKIIAKQIGIWEYQ